MAMKNHKTIILIAAVIACGMLAQCGEKKKQALIQGTAGLYN